MILYICSKCQCVEVATLGYYWGTKNPKKYKWDATNIQYKDKPLCSQHSPKFFSNGKPTGWGKWHKKFTQHSFRKLRESDRRGLDNYADFTEVKPEVLKF